MAVLTGTIGDDILVQNPSEDDQIDGLAGSDTLDLSGMAEAARLFLALGTAQTIGTNQGSDTIVNVENAIGTAFDDLLVGVDGGSDLFGGAGDDQLQGGAGNDNLNGFSGDDLLQGQGGDDVLFGSSGSDVLRGGTGQNSLDGSSGYDRADYSVFGEGVNVSLASGTAQEVAGNGRLSDTLISIEQVSGSAHDDVLTGDDGANRLFGLAGNDVINGGLGNDTIAGGAGDDELTGGGGRNYIVAGTGDDLFHGGFGRSVIVGEEGSDTIEYQAETRDMVINLATRRAFVRDGSLDINERPYEFENILAGGGNDLLIGTDGDVNTIDGGGGDDYIDGKSGDDVLLGGAGNDKLIGRNGADDLRGDDGEDYLRGDGGSDMLSGGAGDDVLIGNDGANDLFGGAGADRLIFTGTDGATTAASGGDDADLFEFYEGHQTIVVEDFTSGTDRVLLHQGGTPIGTYAQLMGYQTMADRFEIGDMTIIFTGMDVATDLTPSDLGFTPPIADDVVGQVQENGSSIAVAASFTDPDFLDSHTFSIDTTGTLGSVTNNGDGTFGYNPNGAYAALALGETSIDTFSYTVTDASGNTGTADALITIVGEGATTTQEDTTDNIPGSNQEVSISLSGDSASADGTADLEININFGAVIQPLINVVFVVDTSGSTGSDTDVPGVTILDEEVSALKNLAADIVAQGFTQGSTTVSIIPFDATAGPDSNSQNVVTFALDASDDGATTDLQDIETSLDALVSGSFTNYIAALEEADDVIDGLEVANGQATNLVYFISDGVPYPTRGQSVSDLAAAFNDDADGTSLNGNAQVSAFGINGAELEFLDAVDNTGGAELIADPSDLTAALLGSPISSGAVLNAQIEVFDDSQMFGTLTNTIVLDVPGGVDDPANPNLIETPLGLELALDDVSGFASGLGEASRAVLTVDFDGNADGTADLQLFAELDLYGLG